MATRYTIKDAEEYFERLVRAKGKRIAKSYNDVGAWRLDYNPTYGGVVIEEIINEQGGVDMPLGYSRQSPREFCEFVDKALKFETIKFKNNPIPLTKSQIKESHALARRMKKHRRIKTPYALATWQVKRNLIIVNKSKTIKSKYGRKFRRRKHRRKA